MIVALFLAAALAVACVLWVARPFLREPEAVDDRLSPPDELGRRRLALLEERDRTLAALKELEFDHRTGQVADEDYRALVGALRRRAAEALRALEPRAGPREVRRRAIAGKEAEMAAIGTQPAAVEVPEMPEVPAPGDPPEPARIPEPYPPPDEGDLPEPARIPEPYPPPDEGDPPEPARVPEPGPIERS
jgi:hypothetical protein